MKRILLATLCMLAVWLVPVTVSAHSLEIDGDIGVTLHVHPDDEPITGNPTPFYIDIEQRNHQFALINCQCTLSIERDGSVLQTLPVKYLENPSYTFPSSGVYTIKITGQPIGAAPFKPFMTQFSYYVRPNTHENLTTTQKNTLQSYFPYVTLAISLAILCIVLIPTNRSSKGKK